jgi:hypothetical protein
VCPEVDCNVVNCNDPNGPQGIPEVCPQDVLECPDGSTVSRDADNSCEFPKCPVVVVSCTQDVEECPDGSFVDRDPDNSCELRPCPDIKDPPVLVTCTEDAKQCSDGSWVERDPDNSCEFEECPDDCVDDPDFIYRPKKRPKRLEKKGINRDCEWIAEKSFRKIWIFCERRANDDKKDKREVREYCRSTCLEAGFQMVESGELEQFEPTKICPNYTATM